MNITLINQIPQVLAVPVGQTPAQFLTGIRSDIAEGNITGNLSGIGKNYLAGVFDNADMELDSYQGITLAPTDIFVVQYIPGDFDLDGVVSPNGYNALIIGLTKGYTNGPNDGLGFSNKETGVITPSDWVIYIQALKIVELQNQILALQAQLPKKA